MNQTTDKATMHMSLDELREFASRILLENGLSAAQVPGVTETLVAGERDGCGAHGIYRLLSAVRSMRLGKINRHASPIVTEPGPSLVRVDGDRGFAQLAFEAGRPLLIEKARHYGIAALALNRCVHFAALWPEVEAIASENLVAIAMTSNHAWVAPAGGTQPLFGTNPIAFGWPRPGQEPFVFDFATSAIARGELELHRRGGRQLPPGCGIDRDGNPTTDPAAIAAGAMLPFGGHKGSALALMVELLAGPLIGDLTSKESLLMDDGAGAAPIGGELILAIDRSRFNDTPASADQAEALFQQIVGQGARLPSQRRYIARKRSLAEGVHIPAALYEELAGLGR
jgi:delta1-piperideine-2-carboxylate reductase